MFIAEREGFEPPEPFSSTVFKTAVIDHSTTSPSAENLQNPVWDCKDIHILCFCKKKLYFHIRLICAGSGLAAELSAGGAVVADGNAGSTGAAGRSERGVGGGELRRERPSRTRWIGRGGEGESEGKEKSGKVNKEPLTNKKIMLWIPMSN